MADFELAIIGGGINGAGLARDAAGRGIKVLLVEMNDLGSGTSSASSKLIHGGLRYLEHGAFRLVREALNEREVLLRIAPHLVRPMRFMLPPIPGLRSSLLLRFGLILYDILGARKLLPASRTVDLTHHKVGQPLKRTFRYGFEYSDCWVDDSRLVVVNAGGPWIGPVADTVIRRPLPTPVRLIKGSHIVIRRRFDHDYGYLLQAADRRVVFVLPFADDFTLIGTTDQNFVGDLASLAPDTTEIAYLCDAVNQYFRDKVIPDELVWSFAGVRALYDDHADRPEDVTRDYELVLDQSAGEAPLLTIYGGKITTHRKLAEAAMLKIGHYFGGRPPWTANSNLPGGEFSPEEFNAQVTETMQRWPFLSVAHAQRLMHAYGLRTERFLADAKSMDDLGPCFAGDLTAAEVRYVVENEWAQSADDVLWRRSKIGLRATAEDCAALDRFIGSTSGKAAATAH